MSKNPLTLYQREAKKASPIYRKRLKAIESTPEEMQPDDVFETGFITGCIWLMAYIKGESSEQ